MITPADLPTVRVVLRGPVDLIRPASGRPVRVEVVFDAHVPHDVEGVVRPFARLRRYNGTPGSFVSLGGPLLTERPDSWKAAAWTGIYPADIRAVSPHVFSPYEYLPESGPGVPHRITGNYSFATAEQKIFALEGRGIHGYGREDGLHDDRLLDEIARLRAAAAAGILLMPKGFFVSRHLPRWEVRQDHRDRDLAVLELADHTPRSEEWSFRADRFEAALQSLQDAPFRRKEVAGELLHWDAGLAPVQEEDVVRLARTRAPDLIRWRGVSPDLLESRFVHDWHDLGNAPGIVAEEGRPGAERILECALRMLDHRMGFESGGIAWRAFRDRILQEGVALPVTAPAPEARP